MEELIIQEDDFKMTNCGGNLWDLELLYTVRPKGQPQRHEFRVKGYGMRLVRCMQDIVNYRLTKKRSDPYSMKEYIKEYKLEMKKLEELLKDY